MCQLEKKINTKDMLIKQLIDVEKRKQNQANLGPD
jgi:hypothetical protein